MSFYGETPATIAQAFSYQQRPITPASPARVNFAYCDNNISSQLRRVFEVQSSYIRQLIISYTNDSIYGNGNGSKSNEEKKVILNRLLKNAHEFGKLFLPYAGTAKSSNITRLMKQNVMGIDSIIKNTTKGYLQQAKISIENNRDNGIEIARQLQLINPRFLPIHKINSAYRYYLDLIVNQINGRSKQNWNLDIKNQDKLRDQAMVLADMISAGLLNNIKKL